MTFRLNLLAIFIASVLAYSCSSEANDTEAKKQKLIELKKEMAELKSEISKIEEELIKQDSSYALSKDKSVLVSVEKLETAPFEHKIQVRGAVASDRNVLVSAEAMAKITRILVEEGENVKSGQVLIELDASILRNNIKELETSLELAETLFEKQKNLWEQNIGTEVQYLQAKNQKESLERKLKTTYSQLDNYIIRAPFDGQINQLDVKKGEMMTPGMPLCRVVSLSEMYIQSDVSEKYVGKFKIGDSVNVDIPAIGLETGSVITAIGQVINEQNRTFRIEVKLPKKYSENARPNQVAVLTITDYVNKSAITIPTRIVQKDADGNYVYVSENSENGLVAKKKHIIIGKSFNYETEVQNGLKSDDVILTEGYRDVADGTLIKTRS